MKNLKKISSAVIFFTVLLIITSCTKYLDIQSNDEQIIPKDLESLQKLMDNSVKMNTGVAAYGEVSADDYYIGQTTYDMLLDWEKKTYIWQND